MYIEKKYHTEARKEMERILREIEEEKAALTDAQRAAEQEKDLAEAEAIARYVEEADRQSMHVINAERIKWFSSLGVDAMKMAEALMLDVVIKTEGTVGWIQLSTDYFILNRSCPDEARETLSNLIKSCDDFYMSVEKEDSANEDESAATEKNDLVRMQFLFDLTMKVPR